MVIKLLDRRKCYEINEMFIDQSSKSSLTCIIDDVDNLMNKVHGKIY